jgi:hypothetical protein
MIYMYYGNMLTWVRSPNSLHNFETLKDYKYLLVCHMLLLRRRLTISSDFLREREAEKK